MTNNVVSISKKKPPVRYSILVDHHWDGRIEVCFEGVTADPTLKDKESLLSAIKQAVVLVEADIECHKQRDADAGRPSDT